MAIHLNGLHIMIYGVATVGAMYKQMQLPSGITADCQGFKFPEGSDEPVSTPASFL